MRPIYHYAPRANWLSDPNGLVHDRGEWHLFYQYNPLGEGWGHMSWGHAVSRDLAEWEELSVAIAHHGDTMIYSGCAVIDGANSAGFGAGAMVAAYTAARSGAAPTQAQALAWSSDGGRTFSQFGGNPVIDRNLADFRDPNVFWHAPTARWIMVVVLSAEQRAVLYSSRDLKVWDELSMIEGATAPGRIWECPLLIELPVDGSDERRWLFKVDVLHDGPGSGAIYQTGTFDGHRFQPDLPERQDAWSVVDHGCDFYAAVAWHEPRDRFGRPAWIGWMGNHAYQGALPHKGWRGAMSAPRRLSLVRNGSGYRLRQEVEPSTAALVPVTSLDATTTAQATRIELPAAGDFKLCISDGQGGRIDLERRDNELVATRTDPGAPALDAVRSCGAGSASPLMLWLDFGSLELLAEDGLVALTLQHRLEGEKLGLRFEQPAHASHRGLR